MTLTDTLTQQPELLDELLNALNSYAIGCDPLYYGLPLKVSRSHNIMGCRAFIIAWVQRVEAAAKEKL